MTAFNLDGLCREIMALNEANAERYRQMRGPMRPLTDSDEVPGGDDLNESATPVNQQTGD